MNIHDTYHFDKSGEVVRHPRFRAYFLTIVIILVALLAFGVGRLTGERRGGVEIITPQQSAQTAAATVQANGQAVYASSQGTKYYYATCKSTVSDKNKVTFASASMAEAAGYTLASNCTPQ